MSDIAEIRTDIRTIAVDVGALRQWCASHESMHLSIAADIKGLEDREREATGRVDVPRRADSDAPRKGVRIDLRSLSLRDVLVFVALGASLLLGGTAALSPDEDAELDPKTAAKLERALRVVSALEPVLLAHPQTVQETGEDE